MPVCHYPGESQHQQPVLLACGAVVPAAGDENRLLMLALTGIVTDRR